MRTGSSPPPPHATDPGCASGLAVAEELDPLLRAEAPSLRILVVGGCGFLGRHLLPRLLSRGHRVRVLCRRRPPELDRAWAGVEWRTADVTEPATLSGIATGCDRIAYLAGVAPGSPSGDPGRVHVAGLRNVLARAQESGTTRFIFVSALGASPDAGTFLRSKFRGEEAVVGSGIEYVICRPAVIYGPGDHFVSVLSAVLRRLPVFPLAGSGAFRLQPVAVEDVADALAQTLERPDLANTTHDLAGPDPLRFEEIVRIVGAAIGVRRPILPLPAIAARLAGRIVRGLGAPRPFGPADLETLRGGGVLQGQDNPLRSVFRIKPLPFADAVADYA
ncbi:MAG: NAD-dependent epimerase/dehydratase family protein [Gemmatimonadota bacterium]